MFSVIFSAQIRQNFKFLEKHAFLQKNDFFPVFFGFLDPARKKTKAQPFHQKTKPGFASLFLQDMQTN